MNDLKINDIKSLVDVPDFSLYIFIGLVLCLLGLLLYISYHVYKKIKYKKVNMQKIYINNLKDIDIKQSKNAAYVITKYVLLLSKNENQEKLSSELIEDLNQYKYKKVANDFSAKTVDLFSKFKDTL